MFATLSRYLLLVLCLLAQPLRAEVVDIDNHRLAQLLAQGVPLVDVRTEPEWRETGVVAGSRLLTFFDAQGRVDPQAWLARLQGVAAPERPVILICRSGRRSMAAARFLVDQGGYKTVYNVSGGVQSWSKDGRALVPPTTVMAVCPAGRSC